MFTEARGWPWLLLAIWAATCTCGCLCGTASAALQQRWHRSWNSWLAGEQHTGTSAAQPAKGHIVEQPHLGCPCHAVFQQHAVCGVSSKAFLSQFCISAC